MHADMDDAPYYLEARKSSSKQLVAIIAIGSAVTFGAIMLIPGPGRIEAPSLAMRPATSLQQPQPYTTSTASELSRETPNPSVESYQASKPQPESATTRQTSFNDTNYLPRGADNVVSYPTPVEVKKPAKKELKVVVVGKPERRLRDYCPYREGSVERRNCKMQMDLSRQD